MSETASAWPIGPPSCAWRSIARSPSRRHVDATRRWRTCWRSESDPSPTRCDCPRSPACSPTARSRGFRAAWRPSLVIAGFRGAIVPVYDLHLLLGRPAVETPRWLAIAAARAGGARIRGFRRPPPCRAAMRDRAAAGRGPSIAGLFRDLRPSDGLVRPIMHLPSVLAAIKTARPEAAPHSERSDDRCSKELDLR